MGWEGLVPKAVSWLYPMFNTLSVATRVTGFVVAVPALFMNLSDVTDLTSIGTLFAFVVVCGGLLVLQQKNKVAGSSRYNVPYINGKYLLPALVVLAIILNLRFNLEYWVDFFTYDMNLQGFFRKLPMMIFITTCVVLSWISYKKKLSLIPVLGLLCCLFLMTKLGHSNWLRFLIWLATGLVVYFAFSRKNSKLNQATNTHGIQVP